MEIEIKKTVRAGNSSAVILPRAWLNKEVRVELVKKTNEKILRDVLEIIEKHMSYERIIGIYLSGSYARGEESGDSDVDVLVISDEVDMKEIREGLYSILIVSWGLLKWKLENDIFPVGPMIKEAIPLINGDYLKHLKETIYVTKKNIKWYLDTTEEKLDALKKHIENSYKIVDNRVIYTLVLRIRTIKMIQKLVKNQVYSKQELVKLINKVSGSKNAYKSYLGHKNGLNKSNVTSKKEAEKLYEYLKQEFVRVKGISYHT